MEITTLQVINIPRSIDQRQFAARVDISGFANMYDFLYLPADFTTGVPMGYAFINFTMVQACGLFIMKWKGTHMTQRSDTSAIELRLATHQGLDALKAHLGRQRIRNPEHRPLVHRAPRGSARQRRKP